MSLGHVRKMRKGQHLLLNLWKTNCAWAMVEERRGRGGDSDRWADGHLKEEVIEWIRTRTVLLPQAKRTLLLQVWKEPE